MLPGRSSVIHAILPVVFGAALAAAQPELALDQTAEPGPTTEVTAGVGAVPTGVPTAGGIALLVFLDYEENVRPSAHPGEIRQAACAALSAELGRSGLTVATHPEVEPALRAWGVRSAGDVPHDLLHTLGAELGVRNVVIAQVVIYRQRLLLLARGLDRPSGELRWADIAEAAIPATFWTEENDAVGSWTEMVARAAADLAVHWGAPGATADLDVQDALDATRLAVVPLRSVGLDVRSASIAEHALLAALLAAGPYRIPDPGLVRTVLRTKGFDPLLLGPAGRTELVTWFDPVTVLAPELVGFDFWTAGAAGTGEFVDEEGPSPQAAARTPLYFQVVATDGANGAVRDAQGVYLDPDETVGVFGFARKTELADRYAKAARQIVTRLEARGSTL